MFGPGASHFSQCENLWKSFYDRVLLFADEFIRKGNEQRGRALKMPKTFVQATSALPNSDNDAMRLTMKTKSHKRNGRWDENGVRNVNLIFHALRVPNTFKRIFTWLTKMPVNFDLAARRPNSFAASTIRQYCRKYVASCDTALNLYQNDADTIMLMCTTRDLKRRYSTFGCFTLQVADTASTLRTETKLTGEMFGRTVTSPQCRKF